MSISKLSENSLDLSIPFSYSERSAFLYKKTERLVMACHMVANLIKDNDALSGEMRSKSVSLLSLISSALFEKMLVTNIERRNSLVRSLSAIAEISSLCDIGKMSKALSEMNADVLKKEFANLYEALSKESAEDGATGAVFAGDFFSQGDHVSYKGHDKGHNMSFIKSPRSAVHGSSATHPKTPAEKADRSDRKGLILALIKERGEVGVNDLVGSIKGVGSKTIQRELLAMVADGVLKKQGERRWSRYSIV